MKFVLQECGRKLGSYVNKKKRVGLELKKRSYIQKYIPHVGQALQEILGFEDSDEKKIEELLREVLESSRGKVAVVGKVDNPDYDPEFAAIGKDNGKGDENEEDSSLEDKE